LRIKARLIDDFPYKKAAMRFSGCNKVLMMISMLLLYSVLVFAACSDEYSSDGLTWQDPPSSKGFTWEEAIAYCDELEFKGLNDWRLPSISELRSLIRGCEYTETGGFCDVTDDCTEKDCWEESCSGCQFLAGPGSGGAYWPDRMSGEFDLVYYWSSSAVPDFNGYAWIVGFDFGNIAHPEVNEGGAARCVRP